jgi:RNA polymerase sigma-70 factor (ECF subfamily)
VDLVITGGGAQERAQDEPFVVPIQRARPARELAFERLYQAHHRDVHRYVLALTGSADEADDVTADTFERAFLAWDRVADPALPWLLQMARWIATDRWRRARRWARLVLGARPSASADAGERQTEFRVWFDEIARVLTERQREVLVLRYQRDLTDADIGRIMGLSESGVRSLVARALQVLRDNPELL